MADGQDARAARQRSIPAHHPVSHGKDRLATRRGECFRLVDQPGNIMSICVDIVPTAHFPFTEIEFGDASIDLCRSADANCNRFGKMAGAEQARMEDMRRACCYEFCSQQIDVGLSGAGKFNIAGAVTNAAQTFIDCGVADHNQTLVLQRIRVCRVQRAHGFNRNGKPAAMNSTTSAVSATR